MLSKKSKPEASFNQAKLNKVSSRPAQSLFVFKSFSRKHLKYSSQATTTFFVTFRKKQFFTTYRRDKGQGQRLANLQGLFQGFFSE